MHYGPGLDYTQGLETLKQCLQSKAEDEVSTLEFRLLDNLHRERLFGTTQEIRAERATVISQLNVLANQYCQMSFNDMCRNSPREHILPLPLSTSSLATSTTILPNVSIELLTDFVPTSYSSVLTNATFPLVTITFDNTGLQCQDVLLSCYVYIEAYSYKVSDNLSVSRGTIGKLTFFPTLIPERIKTLNVDRFAVLHVLVDYTLPFKHNAPYSKQITLQARNTALLGQRGTQGSIDLTRYLAAWVTPHCHEVEQLLNVASKYLPSYGFRGYVRAPVLHEMADIIREQVQAIFRLFKCDRPLTYIDTSFNLMKHDNHITQRVHLPSETLSLGGAANCLDGTVLFASLLEAIGIAPLILLVPGHALLGWKIYKDDEQKEVCLDDVDLYEFLETTAIRSQDFLSVCTLAQKIFTDVREQGLFARDLDDVGGSARLIDVAICRKQGIPPLE